MKNQKGFSLIELLIVVVIIGIIAAIAIPNLLAARRSANEGSAISALRTTHGAEMTYASTTGAGSYGDLKGLGAANVLDSVLGCSTGTGTTACTKSGYNFIATPTAAGTGTPATFNVTAAPVTPSPAVTATGTRNFGIATEGVLYSGVTIGSGSFSGGSAMNN